MLGDRTAVTAKKVYSLRSYTPCGTFRLTTSRSISVLLHFQIPQWVMHKEDREECHSAEHESPLEEDCLNAQR